MSSNEHDLTKAFARWQLIAALTGLLGSIILNSINPAPALTWIAAISAANAAACGLVLLLARQSRWQLATYLLVASGIASIAAAAPVVGATTAAPALYAWPTTTAALLLGPYAGAAFGALAVACFATSFAFQVSGAYHPLLTGDLAQYVGGFSLVLAVSLGVVVASAAVSSIHRETRRAQASDAKERARNHELEERRAIERATFDEVATLANQLKTSGAQGETTAAATAKAISDITGEMSELYAAAEQIYAAAKHIRSTGERAQATAAESGQRLQDDREGLAQAVRAGEQMQRTAAAVGQSAAQVGRILKLIEELAEKSHMLGLNAIIEAGRGSEQGRRFAVIAHEIGSLAERVNGAASEISAIVADVSRQAAAIVQAANQTVTAISRTQQANIDTSAQVAEIEAAANEVAGEGIAIVPSTEQQRRATGVIDESLRHIADLATQTAQSSRQLNNLAASLTTSVSKLASAAPEVAAVNIDRDSPSASNQPSTYTVLAM